MATDIITMYVLMKIMQIILRLAPFSLRNAISLRLRRVSSDTLPYMVATVETILTIDKIKIIDIMTLITIYFVARNCIYLSDPTSTRSGITSRIASSTAIRVASSKPASGWTMISYVSANES